MITFSFIVDIDFLASKPVSTNYVTLKSFSNGESSLALFVRYTMLLFVISLKKNPSYKLF